MKTGRTGSSRAALSMRRNSLCTRSAFELEKLQRSDVQLSERPACLGIMGGNSLDSSETPQTSQQYCIKEFKGASIRPPRETSFSDSFFRVFFVRFFWARFFFRHLALRHRREKKSSIRETFVSRQDGGPLKPLIAIVLWCCEGFQEIPSLGTHGVERRQPLRQLYFWSLRKVNFHFLPNWKEHDRGDSFPFLIMS